MRLIRPARIGRTRLVETVVAGTRTLSATDGVADVAGVVDGVVAGVVAAAGVVVVDGMGIGMGTVA